MKKIFILTGEPSGDKLASEVVKELKPERVLTKTTSSILRELTTEF